MTALAEPNCLLKTRTPQLNRNGENGERDKDGVRLEGGVVHAAGAATAVAVAALRLSLWLGFGFRPRLWPGLRGLRLLVTSGQAVHGGSSLALAWLGLGRGFWSKNLEILIKAVQEMS